MAGVMHRCTLRRYRRNQAVLKTVLATTHLLQGGLMTNVWFHSPFYRAFLKLSISLILRIFDSPQSLISSF